jgi:hypothetical protein
LCRAFLDAKRYGAFKGIKIDISCQLPHLLLVDDILIFCDGSIRYVVKLKVLKNIYFLATGMMISVGKSSILFLGISTNDRIHFSQLFPYFQIEYFSTRDMVKLKVLIDLYCLATVMMKSVGKSSISFLGISTEDRIHFFQLFPY